MAKRYYWLKLKEDFFGSKRIKKLRRLAGGDTFTIIYLKMQLKAMKSDGVLEFDGLEKTFAEELALDIDEEPENVQLTLSYLISCGLVETSDNMSFFLPYSIENTGSEASSTQRVREYRERLKQTEIVQELPEALQCNNNVTERKSKRKEIEKKKDIELDWKSDTDLSEKMVSAISDWLEYKKERREQYKPTGLKSLITQIKNNVSEYGENSVIDVMVSSMGSGYKGICFDKLKNSYGWKKQESGNPFLDMLQEERERNGE